jgi:hypothetical protein
MTLSKSSASCTKKDEPVGGMQVQRQGEMHGKGEMCIQRLMNKVEMGEQECINIKFVCKTDMGCTGEYEGSSPECRYGWTMWVEMSV